MSGQEVVIWTVLLLVVGWQVWKLFRLISKFGGSAVGYAGARWTRDQARIDAAKAAWTATWAEFGARVIMLLLVFWVILMTPFVGWLADYLVAVWSYVPQIDWEKLNIPQIQKATPTPDAEGMIRSLLS